jgi:hypothetical protein
MEPGFAPTEIQNEITFTKTLGDNCRDRGINLLQARDGGYPIVGYTSSLDIKQEDIYLVRTDIQGNILWSKTYGGEGKDNGWDVLELEDGGFLIAGSAHLPAVCSSSAKTSIRFDSFTCLCSLSRPSFSFSSKCL